MQTILKAKLAFSVDARGGFRCSVNGQPAVLPSSQFSNPPGVSKSDWAANNAGKTIDVICTGAKVATADAGILPIVSARALGPARREQLAQRLKVLAEQKAGRPTTATVSQIVPGMRLHVEVDGRKARPFRDPIPVVVLANQNDPAAFDRLCARAKVGQKIQIVLRSPRQVGTSIYLEAVIPVK